eukprot:5364474-Pleurochrysis_carterae.AAC.2
MGGPLVCRARGLCRAFSPSRVSSVKSAAHVVLHALMHALKVDDFAPVGSSSRSPALSIFRSLDLALCPLSS